jgi:hypothetical protein
MNSNQDVELSNKNQDSRYLIPEMTYDYNHPDVVHWTKHFMDKASEYNVFDGMNSTLNRHRSFQTASVVATAWYQFTCYVPSFITKAVALTDDPERQHHLIQIAYDELGGRDKNFIHSKLFVEAIEKVGLMIDSNHDAVGIKQTLDSLDSTLLKTSSQYGIVGLLLSFEIIAEENIEKLYQGLCFDVSCEKILSETPFFKIHRADETEHIRHSIANFLRFCKTEDQVGDFKISFDQGILFWKAFWEKMTFYIENEALVSVQ